IARSRLLLDGDGRGETLDTLDIGLLHHLEELAGIGRKALDIAALALGIDGVKGERGLARSRQARHHDQLVARQPHVDGLEVMLLAATHDDVASSRVAAGHAGPDPGSLCAAAGWRAAAPRSLISSWLSAATP